MKEREMSEMLFFSSLVIFALGCNSHGCGDKKRAKKPAAAKRGWLQPGSTNPTIELL